jgi:hypothetical protein
MLTVSAKAEIIIFAMTLSVRCQAFALVVVNGPARTAVSGRTIGPFDLPGSRRQIVMVPR